MENRLAVVGQAVAIRELLKPFLAGQISGNTIRAYQYDIAQFFELQDIRRLTFGWNTCEGCRSRTWSSIVTAS